MGNLLTRVTKFRQRMKNIFDVFEGRTPWVLMLGLDGAGKTSLLYKSKLDDTICAVVPPRGINIEQMTPVRGATLQLYDIPGSKMTRHLWSHWYRNAEAIVYVVDSGDKVRVDEAMFELNQVLEASELRNVPLIVVANKQDVQDAMSVEHVQLELGLDAITNRSWSVVGASAEKGQGINKVFKKVVEKIKEYRCVKKGLRLKKTDLESTEKTKSKEAGFTSIEDVEAMTRDEKVPSLFGAIKEKDKKEQTTDIDNFDDSVEGIGVDNVEYDKMDKDVPSNKSSLSEVEIVHPSTSSVGSDRPAPDEVEVVDVDCEEKSDVNTKTKDYYFETVTAEEKTNVSATRNIEKSDESDIEKIAVREDINEFETPEKGDDDNNVDTEETRCNLDSDDDVSTEDGDNNIINKKGEASKADSDIDDIEETKDRRVSEDDVSIEDVTDDEVGNKTDEAVTAHSVSDDIEEIKDIHDSDDEIRNKTDEVITAHTVNDDIDETKDKHVSEDDVSSISSDNSSLSADEV